VSRRSRPDGDVERKRTAVRTSPTRWPSVGWPTVRA